MLVRVSESVGLIRQARNGPYVSGLVAIIAAECAECKL